MEPMVAYIAGVVHGLLLKNAKQFDITDVQLGSTLGEVLVALNEKTYTITVEEVK